jgi:ParB family chromosome partitioning protein
MAIANATKRRGKKTGEEQLMDLGLMSPRDAAVSTLDPPAAYGRGDTHTKAEHFHKRFPLDVYQSEACSSSVASAALADEVLCHDCGTTLGQAAELVRTGKASKPARKQKAEPDKSVGVFAKTQTQEPAARALPLTIQEIPLEKIHRRPSNRGGEPVTFPEVAELVASIEACGLSTPIEVRTTGEAELPLGHYELVKGERRWMACRALHRETIPAIVRDLDEVSAAVQVAVDNTQRVDLDPIQRAKAIRDAIEAGASEQQAAAAAGVPKGAKNALRLLQLPEDLQRFVAAGNLPQKIALACVPYRDLQAVMTELVKKIKQGCWWLKSANWQAELERLVREHTRRPASSQPKRKSWEHPTPALPDKVLTPALRAELGEVVVKIDNKPTPVFTNTKRYDELLAEAEQAAAARKKTKAKAEGKPSNPDAERQQDETLDRKAGEWRHAFLRLGIAKALVSGDVRTVLVHDWLRCECASEGFRYSRHDYLLKLDSAIADYLGRPLRRERHHISMVRTWDLTHCLLRYDADPLTDRDVSDWWRAKWLLWPQLDEATTSREAREMLEPAGQIMDLERLVPLNRLDVESVAKWLAETKGHCRGETWPTTFAHGWTRAVDPGPERQMLEELIGYCNKRQLVMLAADMGVQDLPGKTLGDMQQRLADCHSRPTGQRLKIPAIVGGKASGKNSKEDK